MYHIVVLQKKGLCELAFAEVFVHPSGLQSHL